MAEHRNQQSKRSLTGIRTTGEVHLGNFLGMIKPAIELQDRYNCIYFLADLHSLTSNREPDSFLPNTLEITAIWIACGLDTKKHILFRQSDLPQVTELAWYLSCVTGLGLIEKSHAYKDAVQNGREVNMGLFNYPILMAADILLYDADIVPVGKDQKQHVEMARDMAGSLNSIYGEKTLHLPDPLIREEVMVIPGLDGRKMSKSYNNSIPLFAPEKILRKKILSIVTDSTPLEEPKKLEGTLIGQLFQLFANNSEYLDLEGRLAAGGMGWGHAKEELFLIINRELSEKRKTYEELVKDTNLLTAVLKDGANRAATIAEKVLERVRFAVGIRPLS